jgi:hypothetical protein
MRGTLDKILQSKSKRYVIVLVFIPVCVLAVLVPYSLLLGWNVWTLLLFWFIIHPVVTIYLSVKLLKGYYRMSQAILALLSFHAFVIFMIYDHYQSDYFLLMIVSMVYNTLVMLVVVFVDWHDARNAAARTNAVDGDRK